MNLHATSAKKCCAGLMLIECLMYFLVSFIVLGVAMKLFYQAWDDNKGLRRDAEDIVRALEIGDQWRADLRTATGPVRVTESEGSEQVHIPSAAGEITYDCSNGKLRREAGGVSNLYLSNVKSSEMKPDSRHDVAAWRWELELKTVKKTARCRPLFTFEAVAAGGAGQ